MFQRGVFSLFSSMFYTLNLINQNWRFSIEINSLTSKNKQSRKELTSMQIELN